MNFLNENNNKIIIKYGYYQNEIIEINNHGNSSRNSWYH